MKDIFFILTFFLTSNLSAQKDKDYLVVQTDTTYLHKYGYVFVNQKGDTLLKLDTLKYNICFSDTIEYFAIVGFTSKKGWWAIDRNENLLFEVFNTSSGEPSPDELKYGMIRIVDSTGRIGFANYKGQVVIKPRFEAATSFYKNKSIIGRRCKQVLWCCKEENKDKHYITKCQLTGYINKNGQVQNISNISLEQMQKKLHWPQQ